jgi:DNA-binding CsgD family transcriptional regulator
LCRCGSSGLNFEVFLPSPSGPAKKLSTSPQPSLITAEQPPSSPSSPKPSSRPQLVVAPPRTISDLTIAVNRRKRPSKIELAATLRKIRHLLAEGYTNKEIIEMLQLEERTFYRYMSRIYSQDKAYFEKQDNESIATEIRLAKERTLKSLRRHDAIAADESLSAAERMEAERYRNDVVILLAKIEVEGPRIVYDTLRRFYEH